MTTKTGLSRREWENEKKKKDVETRKTTHRASTPARTCIYSGGREKEEKEEREREDCKKGEAARTYINP